jgi:hypothetical protein
VTKVADSGEGNGAEERQWIPRRERSSGRDTVPARQPEGEVAAGRVTDGHGAPEIQVVLPGKATQRVDSPGNIEKRAGPATSFVADAPVLDVPGGDARPGERRAEVTGVSQVVLSAPEPAVEDDGDRVWPAGSGKPEIAELEVEWPVRDAPIRRRGRKGEDVLRRILTYRRALHYLILLYTTSQL